MSTQKHGYILFAKKNIKHTKKETNKHPPKTNRKWYKIIYNPCYLDNHQIMIRLSVVCVCLRLSGVQHISWGVFLRLLCPTLPASLDCPFFTIVPSNYLGLCNSFFFCIYIWFVWYYISAWYVLFLRKLLINFVCKGLFLYPFSINTLYVTCYLSLFHIK